MKTGRLLALSAWCGRSKGWNPGGRRVMNSCGSFTRQLLHIPSVYDWATNPLVDCYIVDSWVTQRQPAAKIESHTARLREPMVTHVLNMESAITISDLLTSYLLRLLAIR